MGWKGQGITVSVEPRLKSRDGGSTEGTFDLMRDLGACNFPSGAERLEAECKQMGLVVYIRTCLLRALKTISKILRILS